jgi:hypothetical protein
MSAFPKTFADAVAVGLRSLSDLATKELASVGFVDPHTKYRTDFEEIVSRALGLNDESNPELLRDVATNHPHLLHFLEASAQVAEPRAVLRVVLAEMARVAVANSKSTE